MCRHLIVLPLALVAMALLAPPLAAGEATRTVRLELSADRNGPFAVENLAGTMRISAGPGNKVVAVATLHAESEALAEGMRLQQVIGEKGLPTLRVEYPLAEHESLRYRPNDSEGEHHGILENFFGGTSSLKYAGRSVKVSGNSGVFMYADLEVQLPARPVQGTFRNLVGRITAAGVRGTLLFDSASGNIDLDRVKGTIKADTGSGDVKATGLEGTFRCDTGSGNCNLTGFQGDELSCDVGSGNIRLKSLQARLLSADTGSGNVRVEDANLENFKADTGSGDVLLESVGPRLVKIKADTGSGDVVLRLAPEASFEALADQGSGDLRVGYKDAQPIHKGREVIGYRRGDSKIRIDVSTGSGNLDIRPAR